MMSSVLIYMGEQCGTMEPGKQGRNHEYGKSISTESQTFIALVISDTNIRCRN